MDANDGEEEAPLIKVDREDPYNRKWTGAIPGTMAGDQFLDTDFPLTTPGKEGEGYAKYSYYNWLYNYVRLTDKEGRILPKVRVRPNILKRIDDWIWYKGNQEMF